MRHFQRSGAILYDLKEKEKGKSISFLGSNCLQFAQFSFGMGELYHIMQQFKFDKGI